jgi:hypothetical protein
MFVPINEKSLINAISIALWLQGNMQQGMVQVLLDPLAFLFSEGGREGLAARFVLTCSYTCGFGSSKDIYF